LASRLRLAGVLTLGVVAISGAAVLVRFAQAPALSVAAGRMVLAALVVLPFAALRSRAEWASFDRGTWTRLILSGACLGLHFAFWISSLERTTVASSVLFVTTNPIWTGIAGHALLGERLTRGQLAGIVAAIAGACVIGGADLALGGRAFAGDALALAGAWMASAHYLLGRVARRRVSLLAYVGATYAVAAIVLIALALAFGAPFLDLSPRALACIAALALGPQLLGHSSFNWALRYLSATLIAVAILAEPVGATLLAAIVLHEPPTAAQLAGGALVLAGIAVTARAASGAPKPVPV